MDIFGWMVSHLDARATGGPAAVGMHLAIAASEACLAEKGWDQPQDMLPDDPDALDAPRVTENAVLNVA